MKPKSNPSQKSEIFGNFQWEHQLPSHVLPKSLGISSCAKTQTCRVHFPLQLYFWPNFNFYSRIMRKVGRHWMKFSEKFSKTDQNFQALSIKNYWVLAQVSLTKLVENCVLSNFYFGQISTSIQESWEKLVGIGWSFLKNSVKPTKTSELCQSKTIGF